MRRAGILSAVHRSLLAAVLLTALSCSRNPGPLREIASPAPAGSAQPSLAVSPEGTVYLSWIEPAGDDGHALKFSVLDEDSWSEPRLVAAGSNWFVNWADFPILSVSENGSVITAAWLEKSGPDTYAYGVRISRSTDGGRSWSAPLTPHRDTTQTEHGFVSLWPNDGENAGAVWLDGREMESGGDGHGHGTGSMTLRTAAILPGGGIAEESVLDEKVCECCQTSAAVAAEGPVVVYRDNADGIRDISIVRREGGRWTAPATVFDDRWEIDGCPVNGPAVDARGGDVVVAWFTAAEDSPKVNIAFSSDGGATFGDPVRVDDGKPAGRVDVALLEDGSTAVSWLEWVGEAGAVRVRRIDAGGERAGAVEVATIDGSRSSGFPRMALRGGDLVIAWTASDGVRTAVLPFE